MIHFKVIRASRLLLWVAAIALAVVLGIIIVNYALNASPETNLAAVRLVENTDGEAEARAAFASSDAARADGESAINIEVLREGLPTSPARSKSILIYHTHTHEAYEQMDSDPYEAVEAWRTTDDSHSIVRVGEALAESLRALGFDVVHDTTDNEGDDLPTAYTRSLETLKRYPRAFDLYIDLHRDAYVEGCALRVQSPEGLSCAQPMLLIGNGNGFDEKPWYRQNLAFAKALTERINRGFHGLCKDVMVKDGRYNQHIGIFSVLIEVGHNRNTLEEALNTVPYIADAICDLMLEHPDPAIESMARYTPDVPGNIDYEQK